MPPEPLQISLSRAPNRFDISLFPDGLADALAVVIADKEREIARMVESLEATYKASIAELRGAYAEQRMRDRDEIEQLKQTIIGYEKTIGDALSNLKDGKEGPVGPAGAPGEAGAKGDQGERGEKGEAGERGPAGEVGPQGPPGENGEQGERGEVGAIGATGPAGETGAPGVPGIAGRDGLPGVPGRDGKDGLNGKDGRDGLGFEDIEESIEDGGRVIVRRYRRGDQVKEFRHITATVIYRGVWREGEYLAGDMVSRENSQWIALVNTSACPATTKDWQLSARAGQAGRNGRDGKDGERGPAGPPGRDLTQLGHDGRKW